MDYKAEVQDDTVLENPIAYYMAMGDGWRFVEPEDLESTILAWQGTTTDYLRTRVAMELNWTDAYPHEMSRIGCLIMLTPEYTPSEELTDQLVPERHLQVGSYVHYVHRDSGPHHPRAWEPGLVLSVSRSTDWSPNTPGFDLCWVKWADGHHTSSPIQHFSLVPNPHLTQEPT